MFGFGRFNCNPRDDIMKTFITLLLLALLALPVFTGVAAASDCNISGEIVAMRNPNPEGRDWVYTLTVNWNTGTKYALSHISLLLDAEGGTCSCQDFYSALSWEPIIGKTTRGSTWESLFEGELGCKGDPSIPGLGGIVLKFEPMEGDEPGPYGGAVFKFYSDLRPAPVDEDVLSLVDKFGQKSCFGSLTGEFPGLPCDPVAAEDSSWGRVKGLYR